MKMMRTAGLAAGSMNLAMAYEIALRQAEVRRETGRANTNNRAQSGSQNQRLRILWVKVGGLWPNNSGGRLRSFHILRELSSRHEVSVMSTHGPDEDPAALARQLPDCNKVQSFPHAPPKSNSSAFLWPLVKSWFSGLPVDLYKNRVTALRREVDQALKSGEFDLCIADFMFAIPNIDLQSPVPVVFFSHNVEHMIWKRLCNKTANPLKRLLLELEWRKMRRCENAACRQASHTITVSDEDRRQLVATSGCRRITAIPTGVDCDYFSPAENEQMMRTHELVFTGSMDWHPNEDAMLYFIESVLPLIRMEYPEVSLTIAGRNPSRKLTEAADRAGVRVTGTVDDIRPWIQWANVYIVPLRIGGGTRLKIFEALAMGKAVVSTTIGAEGLPIKDGQHFLCADDPMCFAAAVVSLLGSNRFCSKLGAQGRQLVLDNYSWSRVAEDFESQCRQAIPLNAYKA